MFFLIFVLIDFGFYVKEAVDCHAFVTLLAMVLVLMMDRRVVSYLFLLATTAHAFLVVFVFVVFVLVITVVFILVVIRRLHPLHSHCPHPLHLPPFFAVACN
jgi:hypothetical protein